MLRRQQKLESRKFKMLEMLQIKLEMPLKLKLRNLEKRQLRKNRMIKMPPKKLNWQLMKLNIKLSSIGLPLFKLKRMLKMQMHLREQKRD